MLIKHTHTEEDLTSVGVFDEAVLRRTDEPNQQVLPGRVQVRHHDVTGRQLHSAAFLDLNNKVSPVGSFTDHYYIDNDAEGGRGYFIMIEVKLRL